MEGPSDERPDRIVVHLLGTMTVQVGAAPLPRLRTRKGYLLLALIALHAGQPMDRSFLVGALWPGSGDMEGAANLRRALTDLRHAFGPQAARRVVANGYHSLRLDAAGVWVDALAFDAAAARWEKMGDSAALEQAITLYRGPLLEGFDAAWLTSERASREEAGLQLIEAAVRQALRQNDAERAVTLARRAERLDPLRESAQRLLYEALASQGDVPAAERAFRAFRIRLYQECGQSPDEETRRLIERLREPRPPETAASPPREERSSGATASLATMPEGNVTFLLADIEDATRLEGTSCATQVARERRHALLDSRFRRHGGYVFLRSRGALGAAFGDPFAAVRAATEALLALQAESRPGDAALGARMALHAGACERRDKSYYGPTLRRAHDLLAIAHVGQVVASRSVYDLTRNALPPAVAFRDSGQHRLPDLQYPEPVYQLLHPALPDDFPALRSLDNLPNNLPLQLSAFIGREEEIAKIRALLQKTRLLTLTGSGGCGKTRLALQATAEMLYEVKEGVWLVELQSLSDAALVPQTIAKALGIQESPETDILETLIHYLKPLHLLLVLDNCEHLSAASARVAAALLHACSSLRILATSRIGLGVAGEQTYRVPGLSLPALEKDSSDSAMPSSEAARLFLDRARLVKPDFFLAESAVAAVVRICHRLDGIPLAIELAAARVRALAAEQIANRLDDSFQLLTGGGQSTPARHQTLRALMDWSYDLLSEPERAMFRRLSIFSGGWTLEATEAIFAPSDPGESGMVLDLLTSLIDKSMVVYEERSGRDRYRLLEIVRQYAREKLVAAGEEETWRLRHRSYFLALAEEVHDARFGAQGSAMMGMQEREYDNCRAALEFSASHADREAYLRLAGAMNQYWSLRGPYQEGRTHLAAALSRSDGLEPAARARALNGAGNLARIQGDFDAALPLYEESVAIWRALDRKQPLALGLSNLGLTVQHRSRYDLAQGFFDESLALLRELDSRAEMAVVLNNCGWLAFVQRDFVQARALLQECFDLSCETGNWIMRQYAVGNLADVTMKQGDYDAARAQFLEALAMLETSPNEHSFIKTCEGVSELAVHLQRPRQAVRLFAAVAALSARKGIRVHPDDRAEYGRRKRLLQSSLDEEAFGSEWSEGFSLTVPAANALAHEILKASAALAGPGRGSVGTGARSRSAS